jgi:hypothetical protein
MEICEMRILIINGSPHKGNTWRLTEEVKEQIVVLDNKVKFEEIHLSELNIPFCTGCSVCFRKGIFIVLIISISILLWIKLKAVME